MRHTMTTDSRRARALALILGLGLIVLLVPPAAAQEEDEAPPAGSGEDATARDRRGSGFAGPDQVDNTIANDDATISRLVDGKLYEPWFEWKKGLQDKHGLAFSVDYSMAWLGASDSPGEAEDQASSGMVRFYGSWDLVGRESGNTGAFVWKVEHRHKYATIPASALGFNLGYAGLIEPPFSDQGLRWTNLYWRQRWSEGRWAALVGFLDPTDFVDVYALASPWTGFTNFAFSTGTTTIPVPNDAALGLGLGGMVTDKFFLIGSLVDRNADPTDPFEGFDTFFNDNEYFKSVEIGWTPSQDRLYLDNAHLTWWHADERQEAGESGGWGLNASLTRYLGGKWLPFIRAGYAKDGGALMQKSVSVGFAYQPVPQSDVLGVGFNWGEPNEDTFGSGLRDQYTTEVYYRWQLTPRFAVTPTLQLLLHPALDPELDQTWVFGVRARLAL
jgi:porin